MARWVRYGAGAAMLLALGWVGWSLLRGQTRTAPLVRLVDVQAATVAGPPPAGKTPAALRGTMGDDIRYVLPFRSNGVESTFETGELAIPGRAHVAFALGAAMKDGTDRVVTFELRACLADACDTLFSERVDFAAVGAQQWLERRVSLERYAGARRRLVFHAVIAAPTTRALWANPTIYGPVARRPTDRNVILISLDTLRADHLGSYGHARDTAPFIDETFARGGTLFEHCVAAATNTTPSHMTMFTALPPSVHSVGLGTITPLPAWLVTVPELLRAEGLTTGAITENGWVNFPQGFGRGFDTYRENKGPNIMEPKGQADVTFGRAQEWLRRHRDERFFLFLHTYQVHGPYAPPPEYATLFADGVPADAPSVVQDAANYDREIRFTDDMLRDLFATIREIELDDNTVVVLTSDHGEEFAEHGCLSHGAQLYDEITRVPLMIWGPGVPAGKRVSEPVGLIDVMPTILDLAGVSIPDQAMGKSLVPALASGHAPPDRHIFTEAWAEKVCMQHPYEQPGYALRVGTHKLIRYRLEDVFKYELYDLATDPLERSNRYAELAAESVPLQAAVDAYASDCQARAKALRTGAQATAAPVEAVPLDARQREKLRALGYLE